MKFSTLFICLFFTGIFCSAGVVEKTFYFHDYKIETNGSWHTVRFENTRLSALPGEPLLPWHELVLMLPPGESATSIEVIGEDETTIPGSFLLFPKQQVRPISQGSSGEFIQNKVIYGQDNIYPTYAEGHLLTQYLNGFAFALSTFTPVRYNPARRALTYFGKVTVRIKTRADAQSLLAIKCLPADESALSRVRTFAMNPEMMNQYPSGKAPSTNYQYLIISPAIFKNEFQPLISMYGNKGLIVRVVTLDSIISTMNGFDVPEKIRNFIIGQRVNSQIQYVLLAGNPPLIPIRGFYCYVQSGSGYTDSNIPADLYFSGLDGNYDANGNHVYGEIADNADLLPDIAVARFTVNDTAELHRVIHKSVTYQTNPVLGELNKPLLAGEHLYSSPMTFGGPYMDLLVNNHSDNGYYTHGIPSSVNVVDKLYDTLIAPTSTIWNWTAAMLLAKINQGRSFIHHLGHASSGYMLRLYTSSITDANFAGVNGISHNYPVLYTQGCDCGAFDVGGGCVAAKALTISNFIAGGVFNSRYGWFDEGTTEGPSEHLEREFVSALYNDTLPEKHLGMAHMISKIKTAPWVSLPGEFEPGAQRWCHYDCTAFGDPAMEIWTSEPNSFTEVSWNGSIDADWNKAGNWTPAMVPTSLYNVTIANASRFPVITTTNAIFCNNLTILNSGSLTINPGKSIVVYGTIVLGSSMVP